MLCWKDKSFCDKAPQCIHAEQCGRGISKEEVALAAKEGLPVAYIIGCPDFEEKKDNGAESKDDA